VRRFTTAKSAKYEIDRPFFLRPHETRRRQDIQMKRQCWTG
jgi:hypothetical protein